MTDYADKWRALRDGRLAPETFSHRDHIGVAYEALLELDVFAAAAALSEGLRRLAAKAGRPDKFNATITFAYLCLIAERRAGGDDRSAVSFIEANPDLLSGEALAARYSPARLAQPLARETALLPDRAPPSPREV